MGQSEMPKEQRIQELDAMIAGCEERLALARETIEREEPELERLKEIRRSL